ncbi:MAG: hypothetical protein IT372_17135 [Polyangiaceae bacterium]|nr:hypothetical protein [Polyangiaceae bacterium]
MDWNRVRSSIGSHLGLVSGAVRRPGRVTRVAFDDFIQGPGSLVSAVSDPAVSKVLGSLDQLAIEAVVDQVAAAVGPASLKIRIAHSGDGIHWLPKNPIPEVNVPATLSLTGPTYMDLGYDDGRIPSLGLVRLELTLDAVAGPVSAHVRIHATANDVGADEFSAAVHAADNAYPYQQYSQRYPAGSRIEMSRIRELIGYWHYRNELQIDWTSLAAIVPKDQMVCFNAVGDYILVVGDRVVWSSRAYWGSVLEGTTHAPPKTPNDPQGGWTLSTGGGLDWKKFAGIVSSQGSGGGDQDK